MSKSDNVYDDEFLGNLFHTYNVKIHDMGIMIDILKLQIKELQSKAGIVNSTVRTIEKKGFNNVYKKQISSKS
jgi:hypothetical protein